METVTMVASTDDQYDDPYGQLTAHTITNFQQQLPQPNKRLQKLKKLKIREIQSLALEGGDTGRGYCSCDEQWTGSTTSSSSSSSSPTLPCNATSLLSMIAAPAPSTSSLSSSPAPNATRVTMSPLATRIQTSEPASPTTVSSTILLPTNASNIIINNNKAEGYPKISEGPECDTNEMGAGSGYNRGNKQHQPLQNQPSTFNGSSSGSGSATAATTSSLLKHHQHHSFMSSTSSSSNDYGSKALQTAVEKINETNFAVPSELANASSTTSGAHGPGSSMKTITLRRNPIGPTTSRLKQQHHVRFSDEKNFSD